MPGTKGVVRRAVHFLAAFVAAAGAAPALAVASLEIGPERHLALEGFIATAVLAGVVGAALAPVFSPAHRGARVLVDVLVAGAVWAGYTAAAGLMVMPALERALGWGVLFILVELAAFWLLLGGGLVLLVCVPWVRRERAAPVGLGFALGRGAVAVALAGVLLMMPRLLQALRDEGETAAAPASEATSAPSPPASPEGYSVRAAAHVRFVPDGANQTIASRPLDEGQLQFPWLFRVNHEDKLQVGINLMGSDLSYCAATAPLAAGEHDVGFRFDGRVIRLEADGVELARCQVAGSLRTSGEVLWGRVRHFKSPDDAQEFRGELSSTFVQERAAQLDR